MKNHSDISPSDRLNYIVRTLRGSHGCPWDQQQTPLSLKKYLLEETRELAEAIDEAEPIHICEEIGDLYFILSLLTTIYEEQGTFNADDAFLSISAKMIRRHPHVFDPDHTAGAEDLRSQWNRIKQEEKRSRR